jgi:hypothetical protein
MNPASPVLPVAVAAPVDRRPQRLGDRRRPVTVRLAFALVGVLVSVAIGLTPTVDAPAAPPTQNPPRLPPRPEAVPAPAPHGYGPIQAGQEAYQRGEAERREALGEQLETVDRMGWYSGLPSYRYPPSLEGVYAYPNIRPYGSQGPVSAYRSSPGAYRLYIFEPWPLLRGDLFGAPRVQRVPQPVGHQIVVTGPGRLLYRPVYPSDVQPPLGPVPYGSRDGRRPDGVARSASIPPPPRPAAPGPAIPAAAARPIPPPPLPGIDRAPPENGPREF